MLRGGEIDRRIYSTLVDETSCAHRSMSLKHSVPAAYVSTIIQVISARARSGGAAAGAGYDGR